MKRSPSLVMQHASCWSTSCMPGEEVLHEWQFNPGDVMNVLSSFHNSHNIRGLIRILSLTRLWKLQSVIESMLGLLSLWRKKSRCLALFVMASVWWVHVRSRLVWTQMNPKLLALHRSSIHGDGGVSYTLSFLAVHNPLLCFADVEVVSSLIRPMACHQQTWWWYCWSCGWPQSCAWTGNAGKVGDSCIEFWTTAEFDTIYCVCSSGPGRRGHCGDRDNGGLFETWIYLNRQHVHVNPFFSIPRASVLRMFLQ